MKALVLTGILVVTALAYAGVSQNGWVYEDMFTQPITTGDPEYSVGLLTRNLAHWTIYASARRFGATPPVQHAVNLALHLVNVSLMFALALACLPLPWAALATAIVAWHPIQVETVAYVASRPDLLMTTWVLVAVNLSVRPLTWVRGLVIGAAFFLALASKQTGIVLAPLLLVIGWWREPSEREGFAWALAGCVTVCLLLIGQVPHDPDALPYAGLWLAAYQSAAFVNLLRLVVVPLGFTIDHNVGMTPPAVALGALALVILAAGWGLRQLWTGDRRPLGWLALWPLLLLAPRFFVQQPEFTNEHQQTAAMPALALLGVWMLKTAAEAEARDWRRWLAWRTRDARPA